jgi:hypothetical protein
MLEAVIQRLNELAARRGREPVRLEAVQYVLDSSVDYGANPPQVAAAALMGPDECRQLLSSRTAGASWVHASLTRTDDGRPLVTIAIGPIVGNPEPSLNVSIEREQIVTVRGDGP